MYLANQTIKSKHMGKFKFKVVNTFRIIIIQQKTIYHLTQFIQIC